MKALTFCLLLALVALAPKLAHAQLVQAVTVSACGSPGNSPVVGNPQFLNIDPTGKLCTSGSGGGGGGGGAVTMAAGAVVSGAYLTGAIVDIGTASSPAAGTVNAQLGSINTNIQSGVGTSGSPVVGNTIQIGGSDGTNLQTFKTDTSGRLQTLGFTINNAASQPHICGSRSTYKHITSATDTQLVNSSGSTNIYICDIEFSASAALNFFLEKSSSGTCASPTQIDMLWTLAANEAKGHTNAIYTGFNTGASQQLCVNTSAGNLDIAVDYDQY